MKMHMTKPFFGKLRRTYAPGVWLHVRKSDTLTYVQGNFHRIQVRTYILKIQLSIGHYGILIYSLMEETVSKERSREIKSSIL